MIFLTINRMRVTVVNVRPMWMAVRESFMDMFVSMPTRYRVFTVQVVMMPIIMRVKVVMLSGLMNVRVRMLFLK